MTAEWVSEWQPAVAVVNRLAQSLADRVADETREELDKILQRVDKVSHNIR